MVQPYIDVVTVLAHPHVHYLIHCLDHTFIVKESNCQGLKLNRRTHEREPARAVDRERDWCLNDRLAIERLPFLELKALVMNGFLWADHLHLRLRPIGRE